MENQENRTQQGAVNQPPVPGGDPDQPSPDLPEPREDGSKSDAGKGANKQNTGYGDIAKKELPRPEGAPKPHQIY